MSIDEGRGGDRAIEGRVQHRRRERWGALPGLIAGLVRNDPEHVGYTLAQRLLTLPNLVFVRSINVEDGGDRERGHSAWDCRWHDYLTLRTGAFLLFRDENLAYSCNPCK